MIASPQASPRGSCTSFSLRPKPPFRLDLTVWALRRRRINLVDRWDGACYSRTFHLAGQPVQVRITQRGPPDAARLHAEVFGAAADAAPHRPALRRMLDRVLGLGVDLAPFYALAATDARLNELALRFHGMKPPRFPTVFEALVNAMSCQQISLEAGLTLLNRLVDAYGRAAPPVASEGRAFPLPEDLAGLDVPRLRALGFSTNKSLAMIELARAIADNRLDLDACLAPLDDAAACRRLQQLRGVGRWTAEYVLLRGLGRLHVFPGDDVGARNHLQRWLARKQAMDYAATERALARWRPYAGLVYLHLLLKQLADVGAIAAP